MVFAIGVVFWFALASGQFDDLEGPGYRILNDNDAAVPVDMDQSPPSRPH